MANGHGGKRIGSGRPPDWLRQECQKHAPNLIKFLVSVADGKDVEQAVGAEGEVIRVPASVRDRIKATEILLDRAYGKAGQPLDVTITQSELAATPTTDIQDFIAAFSGGTLGPAGSRT